jgi:signal transduction histidine kinase
MFGSAEMRTAFASPDRASAEEVAVANHAIVANPLFCQLLSAMPQWVMVLNEQRQIVYANDALIALARDRGCPCVLGQRPGELLSCQTATTAQSGCGTAETCRTCGAVLAILDALDGRKATRECQILTSADGGVSALDLQITATPFQWRGEACVLLVAGDISAVKRRQVLERIFFHDIMNTAGGIQGLASLLATGEESGPEMLGSLAAASDSLVDQIESQRTLLAAENSDIVTRMQPIRALATLDNVVRAFHAQATASGCDIHLADDATDFEFSSDPTLLGRVLGNLLKNALEASTAGQRVTLGCQGTVAEAVFWCQNPRPMPREVQLQVFHRSFSTKGTGRGVGTYSVKLLTERYLKGSVSFVSSSGIGTLFTVTLPRIPA